MTGPPDLQDVAGVPTRRFTEIDFLMICLWLGFLVAVGEAAPFLFWGIMGGGVMIVRHLYDVCYKGRPAEGGLYFAALTPIVLTVSGLSLGLINKITPHTIDSALLACDFGASAAVRGFSTHKVWVMEPLQLVYQALPMFMMFAISALTGQFRKRLIYAMFLGAILVVPCYLIFPAVGPVHVGDPNAPRNCMPSMHMSWALMLCLLSRGAWKWLFGVFAFLTAWATLATGEHYLVDLVVAVPWTWVITRLASKADSILDTVPFLSAEFQE